MPGNEAADREVKAGAEEPPLTVDELTLCYVRR